ncbi:type II toxin-antitoxin system RelE/ParE family toxin [Peptoniphilus sp. AGMB00490]|uniref:Type II toxin-antitoxin system RelE/ParE family toxin n=1 Tax=Peptoniphilus faecalis TaxID=2731255 RepID=A0A848RKP2_9FIRM|nr:type II toxin-antitoxin system RelE/ParE family toxin [Peptoniphilus faecalis]NMW84704.1 type II toxin-antitoxin system RelE/ParE family toxin [Peptoniphilus faecalis]
MYSIEISKQAIKNLKKLDNRYKNTILEAIRSLPNGDVKKLQGLPQYRLRVGVYRIIYTKEKDSIKIINILPRGEAYKK